MPKRLTETSIWKNQRWFRKLHPTYKLVWKYLTDMCDHSGIWKVDFGELTEDTGLEDFVLKDFITACNTDFNKETGEKIIRERVKLVNSGVLWITGYIKFQYENKQFMINPAIPAINSALTILNGYGILHEALSKGYITLSQPYEKDMIRTKDKDIDIDTDKDKRINVPFEDFWNLYDKKTSPKDLCQKKWENLKDSERELAIKYIPSYKISQPDKQFRKDPSTYLNQKAWNNELIYRDGTHIQNTSNTSSINGTGKKGTSAARLEAVRNW